MYLSEFRVVRPRFEADQKDLLEWIIGAHVRLKGDAAFGEELRDRLMKLGLGENKIQKRAFQIDDWTHKQWSTMHIYNLEASPEGYQLDKRMAFYDQAALELFGRFYSEEEEIAPHLVHVTCTGYVAPGPGQKFVSLRNRGRETTVTNAYHMGCYGSIPAIRMGMGHCLAEKEATDIVHTEFCSLHFNPTLHTTEQLVVQSLFADGFIKYRLGDVPSSPSLKLLAVVEEVIGNSTEAMTWVPHSWGFQMTISKEIPVLIRKSIDGYLSRLFQKGKRDRKEEAIYAIHPGGPKIIEQLAERLNLSEEQIRHSKTILQTCGNMSSATLPHVWDLMLSDDEVAPGQLIVSLAFGPGLTLCGALFEKR